MATQEIMDGFGRAKGKSLLDLLNQLKDARVDGQDIHLEVDHRSLPYLDHVLADFTDGPMASKVEVIASGKDPEADHKWRRFTLTRERPGLFRLMAFPTPFNNEIAPLSPGIPPSASRETPLPRVK